MSRNNMKQQNEQQTTIKHSRTKINACSSLLTREENDAVFKMLGFKCQTLNTAVVQIYKTEGSAHSHWKKKYTGVVCFIKDSDKRSYFLRAYCLIQNKLIWEHEIYDAMKIVKARPFLLSFEGQDGHVGLNFVSEDECDSFFRAVDMMIETRNRKRQEKRTRPQSRDSLGGQVPTTDSSTVQLRNHPKINSISVSPAVQTTKNFLSSVGFSSNNKDKKRKFTKADISQPTNFVHVGHVGWDANKGFDLTGSENDEHLQQIFAKAGVSETDLKDRDTRAFIYEFIESNKALESAKSDCVDEAKSAAPAPPPVPSRHHHHQQHHQQTQNGAISSPITSITTHTSQRTAPPPPPVRQPPPPVPTTGSVTNRAPAPPSRPPPINVAPPPPPTAISAPAFVPPPPPPPPPPQIAAPPPPPPMPTITTTNSNNLNKLASSLPVINDTQNALMDSIRKGTTLRKVDPAALSTGSGDSRSELMSEIRMGIELRPAQNRELGANRSSDDGAGTDALADALRRALQERGRVIQSSDEESESSGNDDEWDD